LIVRIGKPEEVLVKLAKAIGADALYAHQEVTYEELQSENKVSSVLKVRIMVPPLVCFFLMFDPF
jgi:deoxyribodipyrimidine photolyase